MSPSPKKPAFRTPIDPATGTPLPDLLAPKESHDDISVTIQITFVDGLWWWVYGLSGRSGGAGKKGEATAALALKKVSKRILKDMKRECGQ